MAFPRGRSRSKSRPDTVYMKPARASHPNRGPRMPAKNPPPPRLPVIAPERLTPAQQALIDSIRSGPRGQATQIRGPFAVFLHSPEYGQRAQELGGYCRLKTKVPPRLSEFAILVTARLWRAQYEWYAHAPHA